MNKINIAVFFAALLVIGACAAPRKMLADTEEGNLAEAQEHQRILAELEEVHALRERMMQEGECHSHSAYLDACQLQHKLTELTLELHACS